jgi:hypothetical protein
LFLACYCSVYFVAIESPLSAKSGRPYPPPGGEYGSGNLQDYIKGKEWLIIAAGNGDEEAKRLLELGGVK